MPHCNVILTYYADGEACLDTMSNGIDHVTEAWRFHRCVLQSPYKMLSLKSGFLVVHNFLCTRVACVFFCVRVLASLRVEETTRQTVD